MMHWGGSICFWVITIHRRLITSWNTGLGLANPNPNTDFGDNDGEKTSKSSTDFGDNDVGFEEFHWLALLMCLGSMSSRLLLVRKEKRG